MFPSMPYSRLRSARKYPAHALSKINTASPSSRRLTHEESFLALSFCGLYLATWSTAPWVWPRHHWTGHSALSTAIADIRQRAVTTKAAARYLFVSIDVCVRARACLYELCAFTLGLTSLNEFNQFLMLLMSFACFILSCGLLPSANRRKSGLL